VALAASGRWTARWAIGGQQGPRILDQEDADTTCFGCIQTAHIALAALHWNLPPSSSAGKPWLGSCPWTASTPGRLHRLSLAGLSWLIQLFVNIFRPQIITSRLSHKKECAHTRVFYLSVIWQHYAAANGVATPAPRFSTLSMQRVFFPRITRKCQSIVIIYLCHTDKDLEIRNNARLR